MNICILGQGDEGQLVYYKLNKWTDLKKEYMESYIIMG